MSSGVRGLENFAVRRLLMCDFLSKFPCFEEVLGLRRDEGDMLREVEKRACDLVPHTKRFVAEGVRAAEPVRLTLVRAAERLREVSKEPLRARTTVREALRPPMSAIGSGLFEELRSIGLFEEKLRSIGLFEEKLRSRGLLDKARSRGLLDKDLSRGLLDKDRSRGLLDADRTDSSAGVPGVRSPLARRISEDARSLLEAVLRKNPASFKIDLPGSLGLLDEPRTG